MGYRLFSMGHVMRVRCYSWFKWLILCFPFLSFSVYSVDYSSYNFTYTEKSLTSCGILCYSDKTASSVNTTCDVSDLPASKKTVVGNPNKSRDHVRVVMGKRYLVIDYGTLETGLGALGRWTYGITIDMGATLNSVYSAPLISALKSALVANNCDIVNLIVSTLDNGQVKTDKDGNPYVGFGDENGACVIMSDGSSHCVFNKEELDEQGNPKIKICDSNFCDSATLQEYAGATDIAKGNQSPSESENPSVDDLPSSGGDSAASSGGGSHSSSNSNNDSETDLNPSNPTLGGQDNSGSGTGTVDNNSPANGSGAGDGVGTSTGSGTGTGVGTGSGSGSGDGEGDGEGEGSDSSSVEYPSLKDFNLRELMSKSVEKFKSKINVQVSGFSGSCPPISVSIFNQNRQITVHCQIFDSNFNAISAVFLMIWALLSLRILLSA